MSKWRTISSQLVEPEVKREPEWIEWSLLDLEFLQFYTSYFFLYKSEAADGRSVPSVDRIIESLRKALVYFYPLAGRLIKNEGDKRPRLYCNNEGAVFTHKLYDGIVSELIDEEHFQADEFISGLYDLQPCAEVYDPSGLPTLIIQVTDFQCGTRCVSASWSHGVADGFSGAHFLSSWAQISRGEPISLLPVHDRSLLAPRKSSPILDGAPARFRNNQYKNYKDPPVFTFPEEGLAFKKVKLSRRKMEELKAEALGDGQSRRILSSADCVSAHVWRLLTSSRKHESHELTRYICLVNSRSRLKEFPAGYFGNGLVIVARATTVGELLSKPLSYAATFIHETIEALDDKVVQDTIDWLSVNPDADYLSLGEESIVPGDAKFNLRCVIVSWMIRFPFFDIDFGSGRPSAVVRNGFRMKPLSNGMFFALPSSTTSATGDIHLSLFAENNVLRNLHDDL